MEWTRSDEAGVPSQGRTRRYTHPPPPRDPLPLLHLHLGVHLLLRDLETQEMNIGEEEGEEKNSFDEGKAMVDKREAIGGHT